jgi:hypothetical protein
MSYVDAGDSPKNAADALLQLTARALSIDIFTIYFLSHLFGLSQFALLHLGQTRGRSNPSGSLLPCGNHS